MASEPTAQVNYLRNCEYQCDRIWPLRPQETVCPLKVTWVTQMYYRVMMVSNIRHLFWKVRYWADPHQTEPGSYRESHSLFILQVNKPIPSLNNNSKSKSRCCVLPIACNTSGSIVSYLHLSDFQEAATHHNGKLTNGSEPDDSHHLHRTGTYPSYGHSNSDVAPVRMLWQWWFFLPSCRDHRLKCQLDCYCVLDYLCSALCPWLYLRCACGTRDCHRCSFPCH